MIFIIVAVICCVTVIICKSIQVKSYHKALEMEKNLYSTEISGEDPNAKKSPYSLTRELHVESETWGWTVNRNGEKVKSSNGYYQILNLDKAQELMNTMEKIDGYKITKF
ncbi:hypothetical protein [Klebsiella phage phiKp_21]|nr:hypothetical protein [Klebsiella phage phiKp_21]